MKFAARSIACKAIVTSEAGVVIGGHIMTEEARLRSAATFSQLWDDGTAERLRASEETIVLHGRRLSAANGASPPSHS